MGRRFVALVVVGLMSVALTFAVAMAGDRESAHKYVGSDSCKMCHGKTKGNQYGIWKSSKHALAFATLGTDKAKEIGKKEGVEDPQKSEKCLKCHVTAYDVKADFLGTKYKVAEGVGCETCHGPGGDYKKMKVMKSRDESVAKGMTLPDEKTCKDCHNDTNPVWDPAKDTTKDGKKVGFDFESRWEKIKHPTTKK